MKHYRIRGTDFYCTNSFTSASDDGVTVIPHGAIPRVSLLSEAHGEKSTVASLCSHCKNGVLIAACRLDILGRSSDGALVICNGRLVDILTPLRPPPPAVPSNAITVYSYKTVRLAVLQGDDTLYSRFFEALKDKCELAVLLLGEERDENEKRARLLSAEHAVPVLFVSPLSSFFASTKNER